MFLYFRWEERRESRDPDGHSYYMYVDHNTQTTVMEKPQPLPLGWERREVVPIM